MWIREILLWLLTVLMLPGRKGETSVADDYSYKAFISYSHAADGKLAPALQTGLHRFAKPWYRLRAMRVFRDETTLAINPELWPSIETALWQSEYFLFLASPEAAKSYWVRQEFEFWVRERSKDQMLIILTDGELMWDRDAGDFDWTRTTAVPQGITHGFRDEPLYLDLRWAKTIEHLALTNLTFRSAIADVASTLMRRPKDELIGEDVRQHRRTRQVTWSASIALAVLTALSIVAAILAVQNAREANRQQQIAENRQRLSQSRQLAAQAQNELQAGRLDLALLLGLEGLRPIEGIQPSHPAHDLNARSALLQALQVNQQLQTYLFRADGSIRALSFSPSGHLIAVARPDLITFWEPETLKPSGQPVAGPKDAVFRMAFSPNGKVLAVGSRGKQRLMLFDVMQRQPLHPPLAVQRGAIAGLAFSPDSKTLASGAGDDTIVLWNVASGEPDGQPLNGHNSNVVSLAFSPDGRRLASGSWDRKAIVWDMETRHPLFPAFKHRGQVEAVAFSPDGAILATASGREIAFWDPQTGQPLGKTLRHFGKVNTLVFSPDGKMLAAGGEGSEKISLWKVTGRKRLRSLNGHSSRITSLSFSPDGQTLASASADQTVILWRAGTHHRLGRPPVGTYGRATSLALSSDGQLIAMGMCESVQDRRCKEHVIHVWRLTARQAADSPTLEPFGRRLKGHTQAVETIAFGPGNQSLISSSCARFDGSRCVGADIRHWALPQREEEEAITLLDGVRIETMQLGADGRILATAIPVPKRWQPGSISHYEVRLTDTATGKPIGEPLTGHKSLIAGIMFGPHSKKVAASALDQKTIVWDIATGLPLFEPLAGRRFVFGPGGETIVTLHSPAPHSNAPYMLSLWDAATGENTRQTVTTFQDAPASIALSRDGQTLAFSDFEKRLVLWDLAADQQLTQFSLPDTEVVQLTFLHNDTALLSTDKQGGVMVWDLAVHAWRRQACRIANRNLSYHEWGQYVGNSHYQLTCADHPVPSSVAEAGRSLATAGDVEGGAAILQRAAELGDTYVQNPQAEAASLAVKGLVEKGTRMAKRGNVEAAAALFTRALALQTDLSLDPISHARTLAAPLLVSKGVRLARLGRAQEALESYALAQIYDASVDIKPSDWNTLCLSGILGGQAADVLPACNHAIEGSTEWDNFHDSRGVARALTGDTHGAIKDFQAFVAQEKKPTRQAGRSGSVQEQAQLDYIARVQGWTDALQAGQAPFSTAELEHLRRTRFK